MADRLQNKVAVITGGTSGIGEATAALFAQEGARAIICGRSEEKGKANTLSDEENERKMVKLQHNLANATPMKKTGLAGDIAQGALYLASEDGKFVNSHDLVIDGGRTSMFAEPDSA